MFIFSEVQSDFSVVLNSNSLPKVIQHPTHESSSLIDVFITNYETASVLLELVALRLNYQMSIFLATQRVSKLSQVLSLIQ